jgi:hypothetical protein
MYVYKYNTFIYVCAMSMRVYIFSKYEIKTIKYKFNFIVFILDTVFFHFCLYNLHEIYEDIYDKLSSK